MAARQQGASLSLPSFDMSLITAICISLTAKLTEQHRWAALLTMDCPFVWRVRAELSPVVFQSHEF